MALLHPYQIITKDFMKKVSCNCLVTGGFQALEVVFKIRDQKYAPWTRRSPQTLREDSIKFSKNR